MVMVRTMVMVRVSAPIMKDYAVCRKPAPRSHTGILARRITPTGALVPVITETHVVGSERNRRGAIVGDIGHHRLHRHLHTDSILAGTA